jgi:quinoprotein glucose dehydrogenase
VAIDLNKGDILWSVANGDGLQEPSRVRRHSQPAADGTPGRLAALVTKNFVFMGEGSDTGVGLGGMAPGLGGGRCSARSTRRRAPSCGRWRLPAGVSNAPMTYMADGRQYIVVGRLWPPVPWRVIALALPR